MSHPNVVRVATEPFDFCRNIDTVHLLCWIFSGLSHYEYAAWMAENGEHASVTQVKACSDAYWALVQARGDMVYSPTHAILQQACKIFLDSA